MPQEVIPFANYQESGSDQLAGGSPFAINCAIDKRGAVTRRPGIEAFSLSPSSAFSEPVVGVFATAAGDTYAATGEPPGAMSLYRLNDTGAATDLTASPAAKFTASVRPSWTETEAIVCLATGREIRRITKSDLLCRRLAGAPKASHVVAHNGRLLANDIVENRSQVNYSGLSIGGAFGGHEQWGIAFSQAFGQSGFFTAESRPDSVTAVAGNSNEVRVFGETSTQTYLADGTTVYAPVSALEYGCLAPHSVVASDTQFAWLDHRRRFVLSDGRAVEDIGAPIQLQLDELKVHDDCFGYRIQHGPWDFLVWTFPSDGRTFAYQAGAGWSEWLGWDEGRSAYQRFIVEAHTLVPGSHDNVVGTRRLSGASYVGDIGRMTKAANTDLGTRIPWSIRTGFQNHGTDNRKHCEAVYLTFRRGESESSPPDIRLRHRDDEGGWREHRVSFGTTADRAPVVRLSSLGIYRRRQWEISFHGTDDLALASATEQYSVLEN